MNTALAFEIYRGIWLIEGSEDSFRNILQTAKTAVYDPTQRLNTFSFYDVKTALTIPADAAKSDSKNEKKIAVTSIKGVITKTGGASSRGMEELSADMIAADNDPDVIGHFVKIDSPGGSEVGMNYMKTTMQGLKKPKVTMVTRQGMAASGGLGVLVEGNYVMAESGDAKIGSHGVMWGVSGVPNGQKDSSGAVNFVVIASTSPDKNKAPLAAINNNDTSLMQAEVDDLHSNFKKSTVALRPNIKEEHMTGAMFPASELVGTVIDAIGTEKDGLNKVLELSKSNNTFIPNIKNKQTAMTAAEYKAAHPEAYASIVAEGVSAERDRVGSWMAFSAADPEAVQKGIESGKDMSKTEQSNLLIKMHAPATLQALHTDSPAAVVTAPAVSSEKVLTEDEKEFAKLYPKAADKVALLPQYKNN